MNLMMSQLFSLSLQFAQIITHLNHWLLKTAPRQPTCIQETVLLKLSIYQRNVKCVKPDISMASSIWTERGYMMMMFLANPILYRVPYGAQKELEK